jgi:hypothetical protein
LLQVKALYNTNVANKQILSARYSKRKVYIPGTSNAHKDDFESVAENMLGVFNFSFLLSIIIDIPTN